MAEEHWSNWIFDLSRCPACQADAALLGSVVADRLRDEHCNPIWRVRCKSCGETGVVICTPGGYVKSMDATPGVPQGGP